MRYLIRFVVFFTFILSISPLLGAMEHSSREQLRKEYEKLHSQYFKSLCSHGEEPKFWDLYKRYRGDGNYIPSLEDDTVDYETIKKFIPELEQKVVWLEGQIKILDKAKYVRKKRHQLKEFRKQVYKLLEYKYQFEKFRKFRTIDASRKLMRNLATDFEGFLKEVTYLLPFKYPTDYLELRGKYDKLKAESKKESNEIYFYRKLVEDGALNPEETGSDFHLRGLLGSLHFSLKEQRSFLNENLRYDLMSAFDFLENSLRRGKAYHLNALKRWKSKSQESLDFYRKLVNDKAMVKKLKEKKFATDKLKEFVMDKHFKVYKFWSTKEENLQAIFSLETILFNEVGNFDGPGYPESHDVARVVMNRYRLPEYHEFHNDDPVKEYIMGRDKKMKLESKWLNLMFKRGEFSFTFFYIPGNVKTYCPDMSKAGKKLRKKNIEIALDILLDKKTPYDGIRYFSRSSMTGRIDMASLWTNFQALPEKPGSEVSNQRYLKKLFERKKFHYFYTFTSEKNRKYDVLEIGGKVYVMQLGSGTFFSYRNPHFFRFFADKT